MLIAWHRSTLCFENGLPPNCNISHNRTEEVRRQKSEDRSQKTEVRSENKLRRGCERLRPDAKALLPARLFF
jgi:hypothetical protein